jgi:hypothetical protein
MPRFLFALLLTFYLTACQKPLADMSEPPLPASTYLETYYQPIYLADIAFMKEEYETA